MLTGAFHFNTILTIFHRNQGCCSWYI